MIIKGYKAFNKNMTNRYGRLYKEHEIYMVEGPLKFGNNGKGIHFCERLEDTLRYFPAMEEEITITKVTSLGEVLKRDDEYYEYFDMYVGRVVRIDKILSRKEIIDMFLNRSNISENRIIRFIQSFHLTEQEINLFKMKNIDNWDILNTIAYYQEGKRSVYNQSNTKIKTKKKGRLI